MSELASSDTHIPRQVASRVTVVPIKPDVEDDMLAFVNDDAATVLEHSFFLIHPYRLNWSIVTRAHVLRYRRHTAVYSCLASLEAEISGGGGSTS